jgi:N-carbamoylputrescine amidase
MKIKSNNFVAAVIQMALSTDAGENLKNAINWIEKAARQGAEVICLPELFRSQYFCQTENIDNFNLAETIPGESTNEIGKLAAKLNIVVVVPVFEKRSSGLYHNSIVMIDSDGDLKGIYRKMHIPDDPGYYEKFYFTPGDIGYKTFITNYGNIGTLICWDQWYPEAARLTALQGASIIFYPTAIGWHPGEKEKHGKKQVDSWQTIQRGHAIANGVYVAAANRIGLEKVEKDSVGIEFWGQSFICNPQGVILTQGSADKEEILIAEIDLEKVEKMRRHWPFFRDRRIDSYGDITKRFIDE